jgi:site-specific DNA recombinase
MSAIIYNRKSSEDDNRQILSIESQENEMRSLAQRSDLKITKIFSESMSAKAPGRIVFAEMMDYVEKHPGMTILVWKLDRLARNPVDEGRIKWLLQQGVIAEIKTPDRNYLPADNALIASVEFGMANQYIRDLRQNVMRGTKTKLEKGGWPSIAPFGYLNDRLAKTILIDPIAAPAVQRIFEQYATGRYNLQEITHAVYDQGIRTKRQRKLSKSTIHEILRNRFYYGVMVRGEMHYQGNHQSIISKELYNQVQDVLEGKNHSKRRKHIFPLRGFMTCDICGCLLTAALQKGKFIYYYCTNGKRICDQGKTYLTANTATALVASILQELKTDPIKLELAYRASKAKHQKDNEASDTIRQNLLARLQAVKDQQDALARRNGTPEDVYNRNMTTLQNEQVEVERQLSKVGDNSEENKITFELARDAILQANYQADAFFSASPIAQREYAEIVLLNLTVKDQKVQHFQFKPAYQLLADLPENASIEEMYHQPDLNRCSCRERAVS